MALSRTRTAVLTALTTAVAVALLAFGWAGASQAQRLQAPSAQAAAKLVAVKDDFFSPRSTSTSSGRVTFVWRGSSVHNVVFTRAPGSKARSCGLRSSGSCTRRLRRRGTYSFLCTVHSGMTGKIRRF